MKERADNFISPVDDQTPDLPVAARSVADWPIAGPWVLARATGVLLFLVILLMPVKSSGGAAGQPQESILLVVLPNGYKCPVCLDTAKQSVAACSARHVICTDHYLTLQKRLLGRCPECRRPFVQVNSVLPAVEQQQVPAYLLALGHSDWTGQIYCDLPYWWKDEFGKRLFDVQLYQGFVSLFPQRDQLPAKKQVDDFMELSIWWQVRGNENILDRGLLLTIFQMFRGRGLPVKAWVNDFLNWDIWWQGREPSIEGYWQT